MRKKLALIYLGVLVGSIILTIIGSLILKIIVFLCMVMGWWALIPLIITALFVWALVEVLG